MNADELKAMFNRLAPNYDDQWKHTAPIRNSLYFLCDAVFADLASTARLLCVGAGTGAEIAHFAARFPAWRFTAVEPAAAMLDINRERAEAQGYAARCYFHQGYVETLPAAEKNYDAAICLLVSQFIQDDTARSAFFSAIAARLAPGALLVNADLAADTRTPTYDALLAVWMRMMAAADLSLESIVRLRAAYDRDVAIRPTAATAELIEAGGFDTPVMFFQAGLITAWFAHRAGRDIA